MKQSAGHYVGWELPEGERKRLLVQFPPLYPDVIAHHVTLVFGVGADCPLPEETQGFVVGIADDRVRVQALVIEVGGTTDRPDGSTYHITWSIDKRAGAKPVHSNEVVKKDARSVERTPVVLIPKLFP